MTLRNLNEKQLKELRLACEAEIETKKLSRPSIDVVLYKLAWSDGAKNILKRLDYLPDDKTSV